MLPRHSLTPQLLENIETSSLILWSILSIEPANLFKTPPHYDIPLIRYKRIQQSFPPGNH